MPRTPDRFPGESDEEELLLEDNGANPSGPGGVTYNAGSFVMEDSIGTFNPRTGGGISESEHRDLDQLVHRVVEDAHTQVTRVGGKVTNITVWTDSGETTKIRETQITRTAGKVSQIVEIQYDAAGSVISGETATSTINRVSGKVDSIDTVMS